MYPSLFGFKKLTDQHEIVKNNNIKSNMDNTIALNQTLNQSNQNIYNDYDSVSITNNIEEFKSLFKTQEKACYELRSENTVLKMKLEVANEMIKHQSNKLQSSKIKKNKLKIENNVYKNIIFGPPSLFNINKHNKNKNNNSDDGDDNNNNNIINDNQVNKYIKNEQHIMQHAYPPPPPPPLPLPPLSKIKMNGNFQMNNVLEELKSKIKKFDE